MTTHISARSLRSAVATAAVGALAGGLLLAVPTAASASVPKVAMPGAHAAAPLSAAPAGKIGNHGCTISGTDATCDLYAMADTASILGTSIPIWGFSTSGTTGTATAPGPQLVVPEGTHLTITLHNQLSDPVSLAFPGQAAAAFTGSAGDDTTGAAPGGTQTYSFTANRPGTFLYEAGHTSDGARQVAMGLAGALVVTAADGTAYGRSYDDDGVLVLSEIDPALNKSSDPTSFDMRSFAPKYRLINGKPYPASDPIPTDQGHTVLLRYVNAGAQMHAMSVLGGQQLVLAQDGHRLKYPLPATAQNIDPGATLDTLVTMPTGPESKLAVYEAAQHLDNNAQTTNDPGQLAFGGMLTFVDTNAPAPSTDGVGPVSAHITASPNPSDGLSPVTVTADLSDSTTGGTAVDQAEFVVDDAVTTGPGFGVPMTGTYGTVDVSGVTGTIPATPPNGQSCTPDTGAPPVALSCLDAGKHVVYVRALDHAGNWGKIGSVVLNLPKTGPQTTGGSLVDSPANGTSAVDVSATGDDSNAGGTITAAEYFLDTAGANGSGTAMTLNRSATVVSEDATIDAATVKALPEGTHQVLVHSKDSLGLWGPTLSIPLVVDVTGPNVDSAAVGPNPSNGVIGDKANPTSLVVSAQITDKDAGGLSQGNVVAAEAFLDKNPAGSGGTGLQLVAVDGRFDSNSEHAYGLIPLSQIKALSDGTHHVYVRGKDDAGNWGAYFGVNLLVDKTAPVLGTPLTVTPNPTNGAATVTATAPITEANLTTNAEFWFGTTDPGVGRATQLSTVTVANGRLTISSIPLAGLASGAQTLNVRVQDQAGNWSRAVSAQITVQKPNVIFSSTFEAQTPTDWSARTGGVSNSAAAKMTLLEPGSTQGLQATLPTGLNRVAYVTDTTPAAETGYHVRFAFNRNTLASGTATALTLFDARSANASVFSLQFRMNGTQAQVRTVMARTLGTVTGAWVNIGAGAHTVQLDWSAATNATLTLRIDGAVAQTATGNTNTLRVETGLLGISAGSTTTSTGTAFFDSFSSGRVTAP